MLSLSELCLDELCLILTKSFPRQINDCDTIVNYFNQLPNRLLCQMEKKFFPDHFSLDKVNPFTELQYLTIYNIFLQENCRKFWLNSLQETSDEDLNIAPIVFAAEQGHKLVFQLLLDTLKQDKNYVDVNMGNYS